MDPGFIIEITFKALWMSLVLCGPVLIALLIVGLAMMATGLFPHFDAARAARLHSLLATHANVPVIAFAAVSSSGCACAQSATKRVQLSVCAGPSATAVVQAPVVRPSTSEAKPLMFRSCAPQGRPGMTASRPSQGSGTTGAARRAADDRSQAGVEGRHRGAQARAGSF